MLVLFACNNIKDDENSNLFYYDDDDDDDLENKEILPAVTGATSPDVKK